MKNHYNSEAPAAIGQREYLHKTETVRAQFWQATGTAVAVGVMTLAAGLYFRWIDPLVIAGMIAAAAWVVTWLILQRAWLRLATLETWTGRDLDGDGVIGQPASVPEVRVRVERVTDSGHWQENIYPLPATLEQLQALANGLAQGATFSERAWTGAGKPFSVSAFRELRAEMIKRGLIVLASEKDSRQGYTLTEEGRAAMSAFIDAAPSPADPVQ